MVTDPVEDAPDLLGVTPETAEPPAGETYLLELEGRPGGGVYSASFPNLHLDVKINNINAHSSSGKITADVEFWSHGVLNPGRIRGGNLTLTAFAQTKLVLDALKKEQPELNWDTVLDKLCHSVTTLHREGTPETVLNKPVEVEAGWKWTISPLVELGLPTLIYAPGSSGKSWLAQYAAVLVDSGISGCGFTPTQTKVLYLDWETDLNEIASRMAMLRRGMGLEDPSGIIYKRMTRGLTADIDTVMRLCNDYNVGLVIMDSVGAATAGEPESASVVIPMFSSLRMLGVSSLCIDHTNKSGELFGSVYKFNEARRVFEIKKTQDENDGKMVVGLFHRKANNGRILPDIGLEISFAADRVVVAPKRVGATELRVFQSVKAQIKNLLLLRGAMDPKSISENLEKSETHVKKELMGLNGLLRTDKTVRRFPDGRFYVAASDSIAETPPKVPISSGTPDEEEEEEEWMPFVRRN